MEFNHISVLLNESIENLNIIETGTYIDCTLGGAGHSVEICKRLNKTGLLVGIDQDANAIKNSQEILKDTIAEVKTIKNNFFNINEILTELKINSVNGILIDLGVSSHQIDEALRGFSYIKDGQLDMRMDLSGEITAYHVVNNYKEEDLSKLIFKYGEEKWAKRIANFIVEERAKKPIDTTLELVEIIKKAIPKGARGKGHVAKKTFQAIRIEVNREIEIIEDTINRCVEFLCTGGRLCIITFHSLEDRIVKKTFKALENPCKCPTDLPVCVCNLKPRVKVITNKPILPAEQEVYINSRAKSAKLRVLEKL